MYNNKFFYSLSLAGIVILFLGHSALFAANNTYRDKNSIQIQAVGGFPLGSGANLGYHFGPHLYLGVESISATYESTGTTDTSTIDLTTNQLFFRYSPFENWAIYLSGGAVSRDWKASYTATEQIGSSSTSESYTAELEWPSSGYSFGIGWDWMTSGGFTIGFGYFTISGGTPTATLATTASSVSQADIDAEEEELQDDVSGFTNVGHLHFGVGWAF